MVGRLPSRELTYPLFEGTFENDVPFPKVGYVSFLEGTFRIGWLFFRGFAVSFREGRWFFSFQLGDFLGSHVIFRGLYWPLKINSIWSLLIISNFFIYQMKYSQKNTSWKLTPSKTSTLPETNSSHLKIDGWNISFLLGPGLFWGATSMLVSGSVSNSGPKRTTSSNLWSRCKAGAQMLYLAVYRSFTQLHHYCTILFDLMWHAWPFWLWKSQSLYWISGISFTQILKQ